MKAAFWRAALVIGVHVILSEGLNRLAVHWRESSGELGGMLLFALLLGGLVWATWGVFGRLQPKVLRLGCRIGLVLVLFAGTYTFDYFYYWHLRPNLGWYEEAEWVSQHPHFQRQLQARIEANMWRSSSTDGATTPE